MLIDVQQGSDEWLTMRAGMFTGSKADVTVRGKRGGYPSERAKYVLDVVVGRLTGRNPETYVSKAMEWGTEQEPFARAAYELHTGNFTDPAGFAIHDSIEWFGASPDSYVGKDGLLEIKCPETHTHLEYLMVGVPPSQYHPQMLAEMACTGRKWVDFVSYDPRLPKHLQLFIARFHRDDEKIKQLEDEVREFLREVDLTVKRLQSQDLTAILQHSVTQAKGAIV